MAFVLVATTASAGTTTTAGPSTVTPALPANTAIGDRVFGFQFSVSPTDTTPTGWNVGVKDAQFGVSLGAPNTQAGWRYISIYWRDYDGVWTAPAWSLTSDVQNSHTAALMTIRRTGSDSEWDAPTFTAVAEDLTNDTAYSVTTESVTTTAGQFLILATTSSHFRTSTLETVTQTGATFDTVTDRVDAGTTTGYDVSGKIHTCSVTSGATGAVTYAATWSGIGRGGTVLVGQTETPISRPAPFVVDSFTGTNGTVLTSHTGETGATWGKSGTTTGVWTIEANRVYPSTASATGTGLALPYASGTPTDADYDVEAVVRLVAAASGSTFITGVAARASATSGSLADCYYAGIEWVSPNIRIRLRSLVAGAVGTLNITSAIITPTVGQDYLLKLRCDGDMISAWWDDALVVGPLSNTQVTAAGYAGLFSIAAFTTTTNVHVDSINAHNLVAAPSTAKPLIVQTTWTALQRANLW